MKQFFFFSLLLSAGIISGQQMPYFPVDNYAPTSGTQTISAPFGMVTPTSVSTPVNISQTAQINFIAGTRLALNPGFSAGPFTGSGYFHGQIGTAADFEVVFIEPNQNTPYVGQFEKLEMGLKLPASVEQEINDFINNPSTGINPFDPEQISIEAQFNNGFSNYTVYGFYYEEFLRDPQSIQTFPDGHEEQVTPANYLPQQTDYHWRIRFAPPTTGSYNCSISIRLGNSSVFSYSVNNIVFTCIPSSNPGFLKKGNDDWHLAYNGSQASFFALGQNIAWSFQNFRGGYPVENFPRLYDGGILDDLDWISNLSDNGGNMTRIVSAPWSFELEWEHLGNYEGRMNRAWEQDQLFDLCEQKNMKIFYCLELHSKYADLDPSNSLTRDGWDQNPYHTEITAVNEPDDFLTNQTARKKFKNKLRYFISRWGYSTSLGVFELLSEMDLWKFRDPENHNDELKHNQTFQVELLDWHNDMLQYVKSLLAYRPILTSTSYGVLSGRDLTYSSFDSPYLDITTNHSYKAERGVNFIRFDEFNKTIVNRGTHSLWPTKPTVFDEMGIYHISGDTSDDGDMEGCNDVNYHNALWATSFMGGLGTGFNWWQWPNNDFRHDNYPALNTFFSGLDFQNTSFTDPDYWDDNSTNNHSSSTLEVFYIRSSGNHNNKVMGWVHNSTYWWGNLDQNCFDRDGTSKGLPNDDDLFTAPANPLTQQFELNHLNNLASYNLDWYNTRFSGGIDHSVNNQSNIFGRLTPDWIGGSDWAFKAYRPGNNFRQTNEITYDTLFCWEDTVEVNGNHEADSLGLFHYHWNLGNGQISNERNTFVVYSQPGTYLVTLIVSDSLGWSDTLQQYIVKPPPCNSSSKIALSTSQESSSSWNAFPNPASNNLMLAFDSSWSSIIEIKLFSLDGRCVVTESMPLSSDKEIPLAQLPAGVYLLRVKDDNHIAVKRIIVEH